MRAFRLRQRKEEAIPHKKSGRPDRQCSLAQDLLLHLSAQRESAELFEILSNVRNSRAGPVRPEKRLVRNLLETREIRQQGLRWDAADVEIDVGMPADEEERRLHPERASAMS